MVLASAAGLGFKEAFSVAINTLQQDDPTTKKKLSHFPSPNMHECMG